MVWLLQAIEARADVFDVGPGFPYAGVKDAVAAAAAASDEDHVVVIHDSGLYDEPKIPITENTRVEAAPGARPTLKSNDDNGVFHVNDPVRLELVGLVLDGDADRRVLRVQDGEARVEDCRIQNVGGTRGGGAILADGHATSLELSGTTFSGTVVTGPVSGGFVNVGGDAALHVERCRFEHGSVEGSGGAIIAQSTAPLVIVDSTFDDLYALGSGGAVHITTNVPSATIRGCTFHATQAGLSGGAVFQLQGAATFQADTFCATSAVMGGALYLNQTDAVVRNSVFLDATATSVGGAIATSLGTLELRHVSERGSTAALGHAVHLVATAPTIVDSYFGYRLPAGYVLYSTLPYTIDHDAFEVAPMPVLNLADGGGNVTSGSLFSPALSGCDPEQLEPPVGSSLLRAASDATDIGAFAGGAPYPDDLDEDLFRTSVDCDDLDPATHPGATEAVGDEHDQDCDGQESCWADGDHDGARDPVASVVSASDTTCSDPGEATGAAPVDCDDGDPLAYPAAPEAIGDGVDQDCDGHDACYLDGDQDGYGTSALVTSFLDVCLAATYEAVVQGDCDDGDPALNPGATESPADGTDADCDGAELCHVDGDGDGYGGATLQVGLVGDLACASSGFDDAGADCDDLAPGVNPAAAESTGNDVDEDCDGRVLCFEDADDDGARSATQILTAPGDVDCDDPYESYIGDPFDCDDVRPDIHPGAAEAPGDAVDSDCDGSEVCYVDADNDGARSPDVTTPPIPDPSCSAPYVALASAPVDCDDHDDTSPVVQLEVVGDGVDQDCDGHDVCYEDLDTDGARTDRTLVAYGAVCDPVLGEAPSSAPLDCDDGNGLAYPSAPELVADGVDEDCDHREVCYEDLDLDHLGTASTTTSVPGDLGCGRPGVAPVSGDPCPTDPGNLDTDTDGVCDLQDVCAGWPDDVDADHDGVPNGCETACTMGDTDGDTVPDDCDLCEGHDDRVDVDGDGVPAACDPDEEPVHTGDTGGTPTGDTSDTDGSLHTGDTGDAAPLTVRGAASAEDPGCGCSQRGGSVGAGWVALVVLAGRRRQRAPQHRL